MSYSKILLSLLAAGFTLTAQAASDEYDYMEMPEADQIADLQDDDRDGVINARDKCPDTVVGSEIDNDGCGSEFTDVSEWQLKVLFAHDSSEISPAFINEISSMAEFLSQYPETSIELQGFASKLGSDEYNVNLSKRRAEEVRTSLISHGISEDRIKIIGFGESILADEGENELAHAINRRVVATVVGYDDRILKEWNIFTTKKK